MKQGLTSIIIPIANTDYPPAHYTGNCIGTIKYFTKLPYEIIVVDNASTVELGGLIWEKVVDKYIKNEKNEGVPKSWNKGISISEGEFICIANSDIEVYDNWLEGLEHTAVCTVTPMYDLPFGRAKEAFERRKEWLDKTTHQYLRDFKDFSCFLVRRDTFDKVGLFDENYGIGYGEDQDFMFKIQEYGFKTNNTDYWQVRSNKRVNTHHIGMATGHTLGCQGLNIGEVMNKNQEYTKQKWGLNQYNQPKFIWDKDAKI